MKIYCIRHQAAGVVFEYPFASPPSDAQVDAVRAFVDGRHGAKHPKTGQQYWMRIVEVGVLEGGQLPAVDPPVREGYDCKGTGTGEFADLVAHGEGFVKNP